MLTSCLKEQIYLCVFPLVDVNSAASKPAEADPHVFTTFLDSLAVCVCVFCLCAPLQQPAANSLRLEEETLHEVC